MTNDENWQYGRVRWIEREVFSEKGFSMGRKKVLQQEAWQVWGSDEGPHQWVDVEVESES